VFRSSVAIAGSLIVYENHYKPESANEIYDTDIDSKGIHVFGKLKHGLRQYLQKSLAFQTKLNNFDVCEIIVWNLGIFLLEEWNQNSDFHSKFKNDILLLVLDHISAKNTNVACAAADVISLVADVFHVNPVENVSFKF
jgi:hypothetical protein